MNKKNGLLISGFLLLVGIVFSIIMIIFDPRKTDYIGIIATDVAIVIVILFIIFVNPDNEQTSPFGQILLIGGIHVALQMAVAILFRALDYDKFKIIISVTAVVFLVAAGMYLLMYINRNKEVTSDFEDKHKAIKGQ